MFQQQPRPNAPEVNFEGINFELGSNGSGGRAGEGERRSGFKICATVLLGLFALVLIVGLVAYYGDFLPDWIKDKLDLASESDEDAREAKNFQTREPEPAEAKTTTLNINLEWNIIEYPAAPQGPATTTTTTTSSVSFGGKKKKPCVKNATPAPEEEVDELETAALMGPDLGGATTTPTTTTAAPTTTSTTAPPTTTTTTTTKKPCDQSGGWGWWWNTPTTTTTAAPTTTTTTTTTATTTTTTTTATTTTTTTETEEPVETEALGLSTRQSITVTLGEDNPDLVMQFNKIETAELNDPKQRYQVANPFYIMTTPVTQAMFKEVMGYDCWTGNCNSPQALKGPKYPANWVSWHQAAHFAYKLNELEGTPQCYTCVQDEDSTNPKDVNCTESVSPDVCGGYTLPTEHEWELAARSGTCQDFWTGEGPQKGGSLAMPLQCQESCVAPGATILDNSNNPSLGDYAWYCASGDGSSIYEVKQKMANGFGLYDMLGNVNEWTADWSNEEECSYPNSTGSWCASAPTGPSVRVSRGACSEDCAPMLSTSRRNVQTSPQTTSANFGFRLRKKAGCPVADGLID